MPDLETRIVVLEKDVEHITEFFEKLDSAMEKLVDVSSSLKEIIAVHESKLISQDSLNRDLADVNESRRLQLEETKKQIKGDIIEIKEDILSSIEETNNNQKESLKKFEIVSRDVDRLKWFSGAAMVVAVFILFKIGVIPFSIPLVP